MRLTATFILIFFSLAFISQNSSGVNNALKVRLQEKTPNGSVYTILVRGDIKKLISHQQFYSYTINYFEEDIASITCNINNISNLLDNKVISYAEFVEPRKQVMNDTMVIKNRIRQVKMWTSPLPKGYDGNGIILGIIDSGIDVTHPDFKDSLGKTRIKFIWDQDKISGSTVPQPFNYGIEWTSSQIDANQCTHTDYTYFGHGTHVCGIAAGNGLASKRFEGCAPKADIIVVALDFSSSKPTIADGVKYIVAKAAALGKPCVINASVGDYYGSHDATDLEAKLIEKMIKNKPGLVMVAAAGNAGGVKFHTKTQPQNNDTLFTWIKKNGNVLTYWCYGDAAQVTNLKFSVGANRNNNSNIGRIGFKNYNYGLGNIKNDTLNKNGQRIAIVKTSASINSYGVYELFIQINADSSNLKWRIETTGQGLHHAWNFDFISSGLPTVAQFPDISKYVLPDSMYSMVSGFQNSEEVITVANYVNMNRYYNVKDSLIVTADIPGGIANTSSKGPTRDGRIKPDISATGHNIHSAMALGLQSQYLSFNRNSVAQGSMHVIGGGTSAASPVVAGLAALYLQKYPNATNQDVKNSIRYCAYNDSYTGNNIPNYEWGFGKLDGKAAMLCTQPVVFVSLNKTKLEEGNNFYPNPFNDKVIFEFAQEINGVLTVYGSHGELLYTQNIKGNNYCLDSQDLPANCNGLLFAVVHTSDTVFNYKLVKEN